MSASPNLQLPYLDANQNQKTVTHNQALRMLDALVSLGVQSSALAAPPAAPADGARWIVAPGGTGAWAGQDLKVAAWQDGAWSFFAPGPGTIAFDAGQNTLVAWTGAAWTPLGSLLPLLGVAAVGVGTAPDRANPLSATLNAALLNALPAAAGGTGDVRLKLNKAAPGNTATLLFQDGFSGRAEVGLAGDDDFHFKVSADGATFFDAMVVAAADGAVRFLLSPTAPTPAAGDSSARLATTAFVAAATAAAASALVAAAPGALDTLKELADALGDDPNFAATVTNALAGKAPLAGPAFTGSVGIGTAAPAAALHVAGQTALFGASPTAYGALMYHGDAANPFLGIYDNNNRLFYGISAQCPAPAGATTLGGYYGGLGVCGGTDGAGRPIFGVLTSKQGGNGIGHTAMTVLDTNVVETFNSTLDDGAGNMTVKGTCSAAQVTASQFNAGWGSGAPCGFSIITASTATRLFDDGNAHLETTTGTIWLGQKGVTLVDIASGGGAVGIGSGGVLTSVRGPLAIMPAAAAPNTAQQGALYTDSTLTALRWHDGTKWSRVTNFAKFAAYPGSDCYIAAATWTKVNFNNADTNAQGAFTASNSRFTAPEAGVYKVGATLAYKQNNSSAPTALQLAFYKNGAACGRGRAGVTNLVPGISTANGTAVLSLAAGDTVEAWACFTGADGYVAAADSCFWADQLP